MGISHVNNAHLNVPNAIHKYFVKNALEIGLLQQENVFANKAFLEIVYLLTAKLLNSL
jgi:hypothetical protein